MTASPRISVIIPHYNDEERLVKCVRALDAQRGVSRDEYEIVVGDNDSPIGTDEVQRMVGDLARVVHVPERGAGPARNAAVANSSGSILAFIDADCHPHPDWLREGVAKLSAGQVVGGCIRVSVPDETNMSGAEAFERVFAFDNRQYVERKNFSVTANLFCERTTFDAVGPFKLHVSEDKDWCHRAVEEGYAMTYAPAAIVDHPARQDWEAMLGKWARIDRETYALARQNGWSNAKWRIYATLLPLSILPHAIRCLRSPTIKGASTRARAIAMLVRLRMWRFWDYQRLAS